MVVHYLPFILSLCAVAHAVPYTRSRGYAAPSQPTAVRSNSSSPPYPTVVACKETYWLEEIKHQGIAPFNTNDTSYQVFRNVKDYGAKGDGRTDDTAAIQKAIADGNRCAPSLNGCQSTTRTPAVVYFPGGTYLISQSIIDYYHTQIIGNPNCLPTLLAASNFSTTAGLGLIDGNPYQSNGSPGFKPTNTFFRQVRNLIFDMTQVPKNVSVTGINWTSSQATSLQNLVFKMSKANGTQHQGVFCAEGSGGFMTDLVIQGGKIGCNWGNQQFTTRNLTFTDSVVAIQQNWDWGWTYSGVSVNNCQVALNMSMGTPDALLVGSVTLIDSEIKNTPIGVLTMRTANTQPDAAQSLYLENVKLENVQSAVASPNGTILAGSSGMTTISAWADGHRYLPNGPVEARGEIAPSNRPAELLDSEGKFYTRSKPQYEKLPVSQFISARSEGCKGDGVTDDSAALSAAILKAHEAGKILFIDAGYYKVTRTIYVPSGSKIVGEALSAIILSSGDFFNDINKPQPVVQVGKTGEHGTTEWSDMFVSTQGAQAGAILIEWNLSSVGDGYGGASTPSGLWDVHARIGGFAGSDLQAAECPITPNVTVTSSNIDKHCIAAYMHMHVTKEASGVYLENTWFWTADHDLDDPINNNTQITVYTGRGMYVESTKGALWFWGTAVEHNSLYQYQFADTKDIFLGYAQTETAYYQPNPNALIPFPTNPTLNDPVFEASSASPLPSSYAPSPTGYSSLSPSATGWNSTSTNVTAVNSAEGWGLRILRSSNILGYGVGLYSFFSNYNTSCSDIGNGEVCQTRILSIEESSDIELYNYNTVGATSMITLDGKDIARSWQDNNSTYVDTINVFRTG